jgi:hypothetical protein
VSRSRPGSNRRTNERVDPDGAYAESVARVPKEQGIIGNEEWNGKGRLMMGMRNRGRAEIRDSDASKVKTVLGIEWIVSR